MARKQTIRVVINDDGTTEIGVVDGDGRTCIKQLEELEAELGFDRAEIQRKPEFYRSNSAKNRVKSRC